MSFATLDDVGWTGKTALVRLDLNVPMADGKVTDTTRIDRSLPTLTELMEKGAKVAILSHFGRPKGKVVPIMSLAPVAEALGTQLGKPVSFAKDCVGQTALAAIDALKPGEVVVLENSRFHAGEEANDSAMAEQLASLGDVFVNDAFSACHRAHATTVGVAERLPAVAGRALEQELLHLGRALDEPQRPVVAIVGGAKVSSKIALLENLIDRVDHLVIGGGMANTFLAAKGHSVGKSLHEPDLLDLARTIMAKAEAENTRLHLPVDGLVAKEFAANAAHDVLPVSEFPEDGMVLDIGPQSLDQFKQVISQCRTLVWNGPVGAFEIPPFDSGTVGLAKAVAKATRDGALVSVGGGGDTVAALAHAGVLDAMTYVSTAGGAFLEWMEGKELPGVAVLMKESA